MQTIPEVTMQYTLMGCQGDDCLYFMGATKKTEIRTCHPYFRSYQAAQVAGQKYQVTTITPKCGKTPELAAMRSDIYSRADAAKERALADGKRPDTAHKHWDNVAEEWRSLICPFYHPRT